MTPFNILFLVLIHLIVPPVLILSFWKGKPHSKIDWISQFLFTGLFIIWISLSGTWSWFGYAFRFIWPLLLTLTLYPSWRTVSKLPFHVKLEKSQRFNFGMNVFLSLVFGVYVVLATSSYLANDDSIELSFPLKNGTYYIGQGGSHTQMNYHNSYLPQQYALDIEKLNAFGFRATGIYPDELDKYEIYGDPLHSPCDGQVMEMRNNLPDLIPPKADPDNATGNYIELICKNNDATIYLAHMQQGSITVNEGDQVKVDQILGAVGNSGNTTEPHLHIHAEEDGIGIPIRFNETFLVRNNLMKQKE